MDGPRILSSTRCGAWSWSVQLIISRSPTPVFTSFHRIRIRAGFRSSLSAAAERSWGWGWVSLFLSLILVGRTNRLTIWVDQEQYHLDVAFRICYVAGKDAFDDWHHQYPSPSTWRSMQTAPLCNGTPLQSVLGQDVLAKQLSRTKRLSQDM